MSCEPPWVELGKCPWRDQHCFQKLSQIRRNCSPPESVPSTPTVFPNRPWHKGCAQVQSHPISPTKPAPTHAAGPPGSEHGRPWASSYESPLDTLSHSRARGSRKVNCLLLTLLTHNLSRAEAAQACRCSAWTVTLPPADGPDQHCSL